MGEREQNYSLIHFFTLMFTSTKDLEDLTDDELLEALRTAGIDPEKEAAKTRELFKNTIHEMRESGKDYRIKFPLFDLPDAPEERRTLLNEIMDSYRDPNVLTDDAVDTLLHAFMIVRDEQSNNV